MADDDDVGETDDAGEAEAQDTGGRKRRIAGRTIVLFVLLPVLLLGGGGAAAYFSGMLPAGGSGEDSPPQMAELPRSFFDMPELIVNLSDRDGSRNRYLKLQVSLELREDDLEHIVDPMMPRIIDMFQVYLRELRPADLEGSAGMFRLKEELIRRVNLEIAPHEISDVLFKEIIIQ